MRSLLVAAPLPQALCTIKYYCNVLSAVRVSYDGHFFVQGRWKWALQFFSLAKRTHLHPCQLLAAIVPAILAGDATTGDAAGVTALRHAARASLQALVASQCHEQHAEVTALFMELLDSQPPEHLGTLLEGRTNRRPRNLELVSHKVRTCPPPQHKA